MAQKKVYDKEFKIQAVKLGREIGFSKAAKELGVNIDTLYEWNKRTKDARLDLGPGNQTPDTALSLNNFISYSAAEEPFLKPILRLAVSHRVVARFIPAVLNFASRQI